MLSADERAVISRHVGELRSALSMTPYEDDAHASKTIMAVTKMTKVLPGKQAGELTEAAKGEAYMAALEDVPCWAVEEAIRRWYRSEYGSKHDYKWQPGPSLLRDLAMIETYRVMAVIRRLNDLMDAEPLREFTTEHMAEMRTKLAIATSGALKQAAE